MPELPEVQTVLDDLMNEEIVGRVIKKAHVFWPKIIASPDASAFIQNIENKKIVGLSRRAKYLIFHLSDNSDLVVHFRMTGRLLLTKVNDPLTPHLHIVLDLDRNQKLLYYDTRKFGRWYWVKNAKEMFKKLGPEPLSSSFTSKVLETQLKGRTRSLKALLLDQSIIAGLGNIYVDEALWEAYLHPLRKANTLTSKDIQRLHQAIIKVLKRGIASQGTTLGTGKSNYYRLKGQRGNNQTVLKVFRKTNAPCERCGHPIKRITAVQRSTHFCPHCQK